MYLQVSREGWQVHRKYCNHQATNQREDPKNSMISFYLEEFNWNGNKLCIFSVTKNLKNEKVNSIRSQKLPADHSRVSYVTDNGSGRCR